jgi:hypothetical protein
MHNFQQYVIAIVRQKNIVKNIMFIMWLIRIL